MTGGEQLNQRLSYALWSILFLGSMWLMLYTAAHKTIIIADAGPDQGHIQEHGGIDGMDRTLALSWEDGADNYFYIPLEAGSRAENVVVENHYAELELHVYIQDVGKDFYDNHAVRGDVSKVLQTGWEPWKDGAFLRFHMDGVYEYQSSMEEDRLRIAVCDPHELYRVVVVIDPSGGGERGQTVGGLLEKDVSLAVAGKIQERMENEEIRLYFTRTDDRNVPAEVRYSLAQSVDADFYINIGVGVSEDTGEYGIRGWYNESYFIPEFGNVQLADILTRNVTVSVKNRAIGLCAAGEESFLQGLRLPAARVEVGYLTNEQERALLGREEYQEKIAEGIAGAIKEVYTEFYE